MKKSLLSIFMTIVILMSVALPIFADESQPHTIESENGFEVTYFPDGSTLTYSPITVIKDQASARATTQNITASQDVIYRDANGDVSWKYTLTGNFSYVYGVSSTCTGASYKKSISNNSWSFSNGSATKSGNTAYGKGTFKYKVLLITTTTYNIDLPLTCDKYGNVT